jgi:hypothetical protein
MQNYQGGGWDGQSIEGRRRRRAAPRLLSSSIGRLMVNAVQEHDRRLD